MHLRLRGISPPSECGTSAIRMTQNGSLTMNPNIRTMDFRRNVLALVVDKEPSRVILES